MSKYSSITVARWSFIALCVFFSPTVMKQDNESNRQRDEGKVMKTFFFHYTRLRGKHEVERGLWFVLGTSGRSPCLFYNLEQTFLDGVSTFFLYRDSIHICYHRFKTIHVQNHNVTSLDDIIFIIMAFFFFILLPHQSHLWVTPLQNRSAQRGVAEDTIQTQWQNLSYLPQMKHKMPLSHCVALDCVSNTERLFCLGVCT